VTLHYADDYVTLYHGDCREVMAAMPDASVDAVVCDPPYGLEFMGKEWDSFSGDSWRNGSTFSKPGIGERQTAWPSFSQPDTANATCATCGGRMRGKKRCECGTPDWRVKGKPLDSRATHNATMLTFQLWCQDWAAEALRVLKPGGHLLAFGGTRTYHRLACAVEDAGFEIRDSINWIYGSGFPKSLDVSKAIDKAAGAEREVVGNKLDRPGYHLSGHASGTGAFGHGLSSSTPDTRLASAQITNPATDAARQWEGWGTALKPSHEPIVVARKPLVGTVAANVLEHGTGALNIDGCRVDGKPRTTHKDGNWTGNSSDSAIFPMRNVRAEEPPGRWPANLILTHAADCDDECATGCPVAELDAQSGDRTGGHHPARRGGGGVSTSGHSGQDGLTERHDNDTGGASRFFTVTEWDEAPFRYVAKASKAEREAGYHANHHPTVKPVGVMEWLVRLVTPPDGTVLDPFMGSGTTGVAAVAEGFRFVGIEQNADYLAIAHARITGTTCQGKLW